MRSGGRGRGGRIVVVVWGDVMGGRGNCRASGISDIVLGVVFRVWF